MIKKIAVKSDEILQEIAGGQMIISFQSLSYTVWFTDVHKPEFL